MNTKERKNDDCQRIDEEGELDRQSADRTSEMLREGLEAIHTGVLEGMKL